MSGRAGCPVMPRNDARHPVSLAASRIVKDFATYHTKTGPLLKIKNVRGAHGRRGADAPATWISRAAKLLQ